MALGRRRTSSGQQALTRDSHPWTYSGSASFLLQAGEKISCLPATRCCTTIAWVAGNPYADNQRYLASLKKLAAFHLDAPRFQFDLLLPGHGAIAMDKAYMDVQKARDTVELDLAAGRDVEGSPYSTAAYRRLMYGRPPVLASR